MRKLERKILYLWTAEGLLLGLLLGLIPGFIVLTFDRVLLIPLILFLSTGTGSIYMYLRYRNWSFELREDHIYLEHGVFIKTRTMAPFVRVQHVDSQRGPVERIAGLAHLVVYTAGSRGADITIPGLKRSDAEQLQKRLRELTIESEGDQGDAV